VAGAGGRELAPDTRQLFANIRLVRVDPAGDKVAAALDGSVYFWSFDDGTLKWSTTGTPDLDTRPDLTFTSDGTVSVRDLEAGGLLFGLPPHRTSVLVLDVDVTRT